MRHRQVHAPGQPASGLPYSPAVIAGNFVFVSGHVGWDPTTQETAPTIEAQTEQCLENLKGILSAAGTSFRHVVKATVFLRNIEDFDAMNKVYRRHFSENPPARSTVGAALARPDLLIEIEMVALLPDENAQ